MSGRKKKRLWMIPAGVGMAVLIIGMFLVCGAIREKGIVSETSESVYDMEDMASEGILWNGRVYQYNEHLSNFLFLGIDNEKLADTSAGNADGGQSDAIFLLSWDRVDGHMTLISIPRDTITNYDFYSPGGENIGTVRDHLSLAYAYGDGKHESCRMTEDAVSNLFYGLSIQGYCAVSLGALPVLAENMGEVRVTVPNESLEEEYPDYKKGAEVIINADNIEMFVRYRDIRVGQSALLRLERQEAFLKACAERAEEKFREDAGFITRIYTELAPYMVTNIGTDQFARLMESAAGGGKLEKWTLPGEGTVGEEGFDEYHVDDEALYEKIIETFYIEAE